MLHWFNKTCKNAGWLVKIDDDTIFNPFVFKEVFSPKFIRKSSNVPLVIGMGIESNPVREYLNSFIY